MKLQEGFNGKETEIEVKANYSFPGDDKRLKEYYCRYPDCPCHQEEVKEDTNVCLCHTPLYIALYRLLNQ